MSEPKNNYGECPEVVKTKVARLGIEKYRSAMPEEAANLAIGAVGLHSFFVKEARAHCECPGPQLNQAGQLVCPLEDIIRTAQANATASWNAGSFAVQFADVSNSGEPKPVAPDVSTGQYL